MLAYISGMRRLAQLHTVIDLEATVKTLTERVKLLESQLPFVPPHRAKAERR